MTITVDWKIAALDFEDRDGQSQVVTAIHYVAEGSDGTHSVQIPGTFQCAPPTSPFEAYDDLTPEIVKGWIDDDVIEHAEELIAGRIADKVATAAGNKGRGVPWEE